MVVVFDLDDTLYDERTYVESGFRAVAAFGAIEFGWDQQDSYHFMISILDREGRGAIFDRWLDVHGRYNKSLVRKCLRVYRHHVPAIRFNDQAKTLLSSLAGYPIYIVTDGHKIVQENKIKALGARSCFRHIYITHRYGIRHAKPSIYCFEKIRKRERCGWEEMFYIGDNPAKDFVNLNPLGMHTVRVLTGVHRNVEARPGYDARFTIPDLSHFPRLLETVPYENSRA